MSVNSRGEQAAGLTIEPEPAISSHGRFVTFESNASNLAGRDTNGELDIFGHDRRTGRTRRLSVSSRGHQANGASHLATISAHARFVAFESQASNLVRGDTNRASDVFIRDRRRGKTTRVSISSRGRQANGPSQNAFLSADGRYVSFESSASNLVPHDLNGSRDVFVHDLRTGKTTRVSLGYSGRQGSGDSYDPVMSPHGRFLAFTSDAANLVRHDSNGASDVFVRDRKTRRTRRVSVGSRGGQGNGASQEAEISPGARFVAFSSLASNLVPDDSNDQSDIFVHDRRTGRTKRVSVRSSGAQANARSRRPGSAIARGRLVAFQSFASNLVDGDTNGMSDVFVNDLRTGKTRRVSVSTRGREGNGPSFEARISADARYAAFASFASNLVAGDTNRSGDAFVRGPLR